MKLKDYKDGEIVTVKFDDDYEVVGRIKILNENDGAHEIKALYFCHNDAGWAGEEIDNDLKFGFKYSYWLGEFEILFNSEYTEYFDDNVYNIESHNNNEFLE